MGAYEKMISPQHVNETCAGEYVRDGSLHASEVQVDTTLPKRIDEGE